MLMQTGGVVPNNADWKDVESLMGLLKKEKDSILKAGNLPDDVAKPTS